MKPELYKQYVALKARNKRQEANEAMMEFIASFQSFEEKAGWVLDFLPEYEDERKMPREIYAHLVFPILWEGYRQKDAWSTLWLAKTIQNLAAVDALHAAVERKSRFQLLKEAYLLEPSPEIRRTLMAADLHWFTYCQHEWPSGILYGSDGASPDECEEILREVAFARSLDETGRYATFLTDFEQNVRECLSRLKARHNEDG